MNKKDTSEEYSDEEAARRRDELAKKMLNTPPRPLKPKSKDGATPKKHRRTSGNPQSKKGESYGRNT